MDCSTEKRPIYKGYLKKSYVLGALYDVAI